MTLTGRGDNPRYLFEPRRLHELAVCKSSSKSQATHSTSRFERTKKWLTNLSCLRFKPLFVRLVCRKKNNSTEIHLHSHKPLNHGSTRELPTDTDAAVQGEKGDGGYVTKSGTTEKTNMSRQKRGNFQTQTLHGTGAFTYIWVNAGKYTIH